MFGNVVLDLAFAPWAMNTLFAANRLRIFTLLSVGPLAVEELAERTGAVPGLLAVLLDACVGLGLLRMSNGRYTNAHISDTHLVEGRPRYLGNLLELQFVEGSHWAGLYDLVLTGTLPDSGGLEREIDRHGFTMAMNDLGMLGEAEALANAVDLAACRTMADVGCGSGVYSVALCRRYPDLQATLLDLEEVLTTTRKLIAQHVLEGRITTRAADILQDPYGEDLDVVLLSDVLYQDPSTCLTVLRSAHAALATGGTLLVRGYYSDPEDSQPVFGSLFALGRQLDDPHRGAISVPRLQQWVGEVGFEKVRTFALTERSTCLIARK